MEEVLHTRARDIREETVESLKVLCDSVLGDVNELDTSVNSNLGSGAARGVLCLHDRSYASTVRVEGRAGCLRSSCS